MRTPPPPPLPVSRGARSPAPALILKGARLILTMDDGPGAAGTELADADILIRDGVIEAVGPGLYADDADILRANGCLSRRAW